MLEKIDLSKKIQKTEYRTLIDALEIKMGELQRMARERKVPIIVVFEGWDAAGKGTLINRLMLALDPRGFNVYPIKAPNEEERFRPFLWRFWIKTPEKGRMAIFDRSWYGRVLVEKVDGIIGKKAWTRAYQDINAFERQLVDDGTVIVKFFLHITKQEQKKRFKKLLENPATSWKVTREDWEHHKQYRQYFKAVEEMLDKTDTDLAPWTVVEAHERRFATVKVFKTVADAIERRLNELENSSKIAKKEPNKIQAHDSLVSILNQVDLSHSLTRDKYQHELKK